jgi:lysophospholipase L1-like esterase
MPISATGTLVCRPEDQEEIAQNRMDVRRQLRGRDTFAPMSARGRFVSGLVTAVVALTGFCTVGALPAAGADSHTVEYVALGDSYAAGFGAGSYDESSGDCMRSVKGYPALLDSEKRIDLETNEACSGATTSSVAITQLSSLNRHTRLVTLTVGGADLNVSGVLAACTTGTPEECQAAIANAFALLAVGPGGQSVLGGRLTDLYANVATAAPKALIVVTGYPLLFEQPASSDPNAAIKLQINEATAALNATIQEAVAVTHDTGVNIVYVDVTEEFAGHGIGVDDPRLLFINPTGPEAFHPTAAGYRAYADAISVALPKAWVKQKQLV